MESMNTESNSVLKNSENDCKNKECLKGPFETILDHIAKKHSEEMEKVMKSAKI